MSISRTLGIDFGTSNCTAFAQDAQGRVVPIPLEGDETLLPTVVFAARGEDPDHVQPRRVAADQTFLSAARGGVVLFGSPALQAYIADPLSGTLVRSPKAFLGSDLPGGYVPVFTDVITRILVHIRQRAEAFTGATYTRAVVGRPVHYNGVLGARGDQQAISMMEAAVQAAGFAQWSFVAEPVAACLKFEQTLERETIVLVVDVGGGTTDCAVVRARPAGAGRRSRGQDVLGFSGDRVGGTDFDQSLAWNAFMPLFGRGLSTREGRPLPHGVLADAVSTRSVPAQVRFRGAGGEIAQLLRSVNDTVPIERLASLHREQNQHRLVRSAELAKIGLSDADSLRADLQYVEAGLVADVTRSVYEDACRQSLDKIESLVAEARQAAGVAPQLVFVTGGMGMSPPVRERLRRVLGAAVPVEKIGALTSVGAGLGVVAAQLDAGHDAFGA
jgi:hypothetical chaperone protein